MKTNLSIERKPGNNYGGNWRVVGKLTGKVYRIGTKFDCTWQISINPQWQTEEVEGHEQEQKEREYYRNNQEDRV